MGGLIQSVKGLNRTERPVWARWKSPVDWLLSASAPSAPWVSSLASFHHHARKFVMLNLPIDTHVLLVQFLWRPLICPWMTYLTWISTRECPISSEEGFQRQRSLFRTWSKWPWDFTAKFSFFDPILNR